MKNLALTFAAVAVLASTARAQTLESAQDRWRELAERQELVAARGALENSAAGIREYGAAIAALTPKISALDAEAAGKDSFELHWGDREFEEVRELLSYNKPNMDGMIDANVHWKPLPVWWGIWSARRAKRALKDAEFRETARRTVEELDSALRNLDALEKAMLDLYWTLFRAHAHDIGIVLGTDMRMKEIAYRRADLMKMRVQVAALAEGRRARMKDPADW